MKPTILITPVENGYIVQAFDELDAIIQTCVATDSYLGSTDLKTVIMDLLKLEAQAMPAAATQDYQIKSGRWSAAGSDDARNYKYATAAEAGYAMAEPDMFVVTGTQRSID